MNSELNENVSTYLDNKFYSNESFECFEFKIGHSSQNSLEKNENNQNKNR